MPVFSFLANFHIVAIKKTLVDDRQSTYLKNWEKIKPLIVVLQKIMKSKEPKVKKAKEIFHKRSMIGL